jgi:hypothetical protein
MDNLWSGRFPSRIDNRGGREGERALIKSTYRSVSALHKLWATLEDQHQELEIAIRQPGVRKAAAKLLRDRQASLLLEISVIVAEIRSAPATTLEDYAALLDVAIEHEIDLAGDIACYGPADFPMITRLLRALSERLPGFEFNSLRRLLSSPGEYAQVVAAPVWDGDRLRELVEFGRA